MKKLAILTSILALAACAGGSGGHGGSGGGNTVPGGSDFVPVIDRVATSNAALTGMVSNSETQVVTYVINKLGADAESVGLANATRTATTRSAFVPSPTSGDMDYDKAKELMELALWLGDDSTNHDDIVELFNKSEDEQNKIKSALKLLDDMYCYVGGNADETATRILDHRNTFKDAMIDVKEHSEIRTLDNVILYTTEREYGEIDGKDTQMPLTIKFDVNDNGKVVSMHYEMITPEGEFIFTMPDDDDDGIVMREDNTNIFTQESKIPLSEMNDEDPDANIVSSKNIIDPDGHIAVKLYQEYISYAQKLGLKYSDFGILNTDFKKATFAVNGLNEAGEEEVRKFLDNWGIAITPFAGGYADKTIDNSHMKKLSENGDNIEFNGTAIADVRYRDGFAYSGNGIDVPLTDKPMEDTNATLVFDKNGTQILRANFVDWYNIKAIQYADDTNQLVILNPEKDNVKTVSVIDQDGNQVEKTYHFNIASSGILQNDGTNSDIGDTKDSEGMTFRTGYYGDNNNPTEATAIAEYDFKKSSAWTWQEVTDTDENGNTFHGTYPTDEKNGDGDIGVMMGFGGTRKE